MFRVHSDSLLLLSRASLVPIQVTKSQWQSVCVGLQREGMFRAYSDSLLLLSRASLVPKYMKIQTMADRLNVDKRGRDVSGWGYDC